MSKRSCSGRDPWQDRTQWWHDWRDGWDDSPIAVPSAQIPVQVPDEEVGDSFALSSRPLAQDGGHRPAPLPKDALRAHGIENEGRHSSRGHEGLRHSTRSPIESEVHVRPPNTRKTTMMPTYCNDALLVAAVVR